MRRSGALVGALRAGGGSNRSSCTGALMVAVSAVSSNPVNAPCVALARSIYLPNACDNAAIPAITAQVPSTNETMPMNLTHRHIS